jgi:hypothetical protein
MKESKAINLSPSDSTSGSAADFKYSMKGKVVSMTYLGKGSIRKEIGRILQED